jgi:acetyl esterase
MSSFGRSRFNGYRFLSADPVSTFSAMLDPQMAAALQRMNEIACGVGPSVLPGIEGIRDQARRSRAWWNEGGPAVAEVREQLIPGPFRDVPVVVYRPSMRANLPIFVFLHGGAFRIGSQWTNDRQMRELANDWGGVVISSDYLHMPEHIFPDAVEEVAAVYRWLAEHGREWNLDAGRIAFGGISSGANIAVGAAIHAGGVQSGYLKAGAVAVAVLDQDVETESMRQFGGREFFLSREEIIATGRAYTPTLAQQLDPRANCVRGRADLFPPLFMGAAEVDAFRDSAKHMADHLAAGGIAHELKIYRGMTHQFFGCSRTVDAARQCIRDMANFLRLHVAVDG